MSSLRLTVAEILTFKVTLSEQNQQNLHFGYFWACIEFYLLFQIPSFLLKLLKFKHIFIFQNFTFVSEAVLELWWSKVSKNTNFSTKSLGKKLAKNFQKMVYKGGVKTIGKYLIPPRAKTLKTIFFLFFWKIFIMIFVKKLAFFETLDHHNSKTASLTNVKFWNINICLNLSNFSKKEGIWKKK